ncbi:hypothetical protein [Microvirga massiliensis]|uniref:hypothetical protein n=1 Tax=Microvirga massiliensis TaxID=1033741 RepID=UPI00062B68F4|nr:hypothetical protein [Microvirga massiliensis]
MTEAEAFQAYRDAFGEPPPLIPGPATTEARVALWCEAIERGSPLTMEDLLRDSPELLARWREDPRSVMF